MLKTNNFLLTQVKTHTCDRNAELQSAISSPICSRIVALHIFRKILHIQSKERILTRLNLNDEHYCTLIDWETEHVTEPPVTKSLTNEELAEFISKHRSKYNFPCHTQSVEINVKMVTEASPKVCGHGSRDGLIRAKINNRICIPLFESKKDFK